jgi:hypothetical protein
MNSEVEGDKQKVFLERERILGEAGEGMNHANSVSFR